MRKKILAGGISFALILALILSYNSYQRFTAIITQDYVNDALRTAQTALKILNSYNFSVHDQDSHEIILNHWKNIADTQDAMFIYVIEPFNDYNHIRFSINVKQTNSVYDIVQIGFVMPTSSAEYKKAYRNLYEGVEDFAVVIRDNGISITGDHVTALIPVKNSDEVVEGILCVQMQMDKLDAEKILYLKQTLVTTLICLLLMFFVGKKYLNSTLLNPLNALTAGVKEISDGNLDKKIDIKTGDELQTLSESFNTMTDELKLQMANLTQITADKERIATELDVATKIQSSMLPKNFSVNKRVDIFATMTPAKEVGGDLYDFYKLDENHLFITIADVSGKGVPAALFMVAAITNLRNFTSSLKRSDDLKTAIEKTNDKLCTNNDGGLFVTAFSGVLDLKTGIFHYVNAGHNPPLIRRHGENFTELPMELNFVLGGWDDWHYIQQEIQLEEGDTIFLYTDGVTEAVDSAGEMYSLERLKNFLNATDKNYSAEEILAAVSKSLENFSGNAEQSDDITMLAIKLERS